MIKKIILTIAFAAVFPASDLYCAFYNPGWSARAEGMGGVFCAAGCDASALFYNPAAIRGLDSPELVLMGFKPYMSLSGVEWKYYQFSAVYPKDSLTLGMAYAGFNAQSLYMENSLLFSGAFTRGAVDIGGSLKYLSHSYSIPHEMKPFFDAKEASGFTADMGGVMHINKTFAAGLSVENIIPADVGIKYEDKVPSIYRIGFAAKSPELGFFQNVLSGVDIIYRAQDWGDKLSWGIGAEAWFADKTLAVRCGYSETALNMGASFVVEDKSVGLDYSFSLPLEIKDNSGSHRIQMVFRFAPPKELVLPENLNGIKVPLRTKTIKTESVPAARESAPEDDLPSLEILRAPASPAKRDPAVKARMGAHFNKATELYKQGRYEEAIEQWHEVLKIEPSHELSKQKIQKARSLIDSK